MARRKAGGMVKDRKVVESLSPDEARDVLMALVKDDAALASRAAELALALMTDIDAEGIAGDVSSELEMLEVEDVRETSGSTRHGYMDPDDRACDMFEAALAPIRGEMARLQRLGRHDVAREYCLGILRGLWRFDQEG